MTILAARRVVPPDLIAPAARSPILRKLIRPDDLPPPESFSPSPRISREIGAGAGAVLEDARLADPEVHDAALVDEVVVDGLDEAVVDDRRRCDRYWPPRSGCRRPPATPTTSIRSIATLPERAASALPGYASEHASSSLPRFSSGDEPHEVAEALARLGVADSNMYQGVRRDARLSTPGCEARVDAQVEQQRLAPRRPADA